jgi:DNA-binding LacI/PurR family transcriptional regulator
MITTLGPSSFSTSDLVSGIDNVVARHGYFLVLKGTGINQVVAEAKILEILSRRCEGIIAYSMGDPALIPAYQALVEKKFPLVMVDRFFPELETDRVVVEEKAGMKEATNHLINLGCQHLLYLTVPHNLSSVKLRFEGFLAAVSEHPGVSHSAETINYLGLEMDRTDRAPLKKILERKLQESPEFGIVCAHDGLASFAYDVCLEMAISVPDQVMIMGYGDEPSTRERGISTMRFSFEEMGMEAATILIDKIERRSRKQHHVLIHSEMILRNTTKPHP